MKVVLAAIAALALSSPAFAQAGHDMSKMGPAGAPAGAQGWGVVKKVDLKGGAVTLQHGPIPALNWPAMTMAFKADPALLKTVKVGEQVVFTVKTNGPAPEVVAMQPK